MDEVWFNKVSINCTHRNSVNNSKLQRRASHVDTYEERNHWELQRFVLRGSTRGGPRARARAKTATLLARARADLQVYIFQHKNAVNTDGFALCRPFGQSMQRLKLLVFTVFSYA